MFEGEILKMIFGDQPSDLIIRFAANFWRVGWQNIGLLMIFFLDLSGSRVEALAQRKVQGIPDPQERKIDLFE